MKTVYHEFSAEVPSLDQHHFDMLRHGSGISVDVIKERGGFTVIDKRVLADLGFNRKQQQLRGLALPVHTPDGNPPSLYVLRPDTRRVVRGKEMKYEFPPRTSMRIDVPPRCLEGLKNPMIPLWITEGQKKADALASHGLCAIALLGVWNFKGKNKFGGTTVLADLDFIAWDGREINIVFDSDVMTKRPVQAALERFTEILTRKGARHG